MKHSLIKNNKAVLAYIQMGIIILVMSALAVPITYAMYGSFSPKTIDAQILANINGSGKYGKYYLPCTNTTMSVISTSGTVLALNPLAALVAVAAGMISLLVGAFVVTTGRPGI